LLLAVDDETGLLPVLLLAHDAAFDRAPHGGLERVALDARQELREERLVHPIDPLTLRAGRRDEVEEMHDRRGRLPRVTTSGWPSASQHMVICFPSRSTCSVAMAPRSSAMLKRVSRSILRAVRPRARPPGWSARESGSRSASTAGMRRGSLPVTLSMRLSQRTKWTNVSATSGFSMLGAMSCFAFARERPSFRATTVPCSMPAAMRCPT